LFVWRRAYREGSRGAIAGFVPAGVAPEEIAGEPPKDKRRAPSYDSASEPAYPERMVIGDGGRRRVIADGDAHPHHGDKDLDPAAFARSGIDQVRRLAGIVGLHRAVGRLGFV